MSLGEAGAAPADAPISRAIPLCGAGCCAAWTAASSPQASDAAIVAACQGEAQAPCYCAQPSRAPGVCGGGAVFGVWRRPLEPAPAGKVIRVRCSRSTCT